MSKKEKIISRFLSEPTDYTYEELVQFLQLFEYFEDNAGKTSGSAVRFVRKESFAPIRFHKPHPKKIIKRYILKYIRETLESEGLL